MKSTNTAIPLEKLLEQLPDIYTVADRELVQHAYRVAEEAHREQKRLSGEPYINHCVSVASILAELKVPPEVIAAGLLHDTVEDTSVTLADIRRDFGDAITALVDGVTKLTHLPHVSRGDQHADSDAVKQEDEEPPSAPALLGRKKRQLHRLRLSISLLCPRTLIAPIFSIRCLRMGQSRKSTSRLFKKSFLICT